MRIVKQEIKMEMRVWSLPKTPEERARWPGDDEICPRCDRPFGTLYKLARLADGTVVHKRCMADGDRLR